MKESLTNPDSEPYGNQYLKRKLREQYQDNVHFTEGDGLHDIATMREKTYHKYYDLISANKKRMRNPRNKRSFKQMRD